MPDDEDDFDYTTQDAGPRQPDRFEKRGNESEKANEQPDDKGSRDRRERR